MRLLRMGATLILSVGLATLAGCGHQDTVETAGRSFRNGGDGGDNRTGEYFPAPNWWNPAPYHTDGWIWGPAAADLADHPDSRPRNHIVAVDRNGSLLEKRSQWDTVVAFPHQLYISPYDREGRIWVVERGGGPHNVHELILKFNNDGSENVFRLEDPQPRQSVEEARAKTTSRPLDLGQPATLAFLPDGDFLLGDGHQSGRLVRYNAQGEFLSEYGELFYPFSAYCCTRGGNRSGASPVRTRSSQIMSGIFRWPTSMGVT